MDTRTSTRRYDYYLLLAFAFTAVASIALQSLIWVSIALFLFFHIKKSQKITWPSSLFAIATLLFLGSVVLGAILGVNPVKSFQTVYKYLTFLILFPIGAMALSIVDIRKLLYFFIAGASICALTGIIYKHFILHEARIDSFSGDKMVFGGMLMVTLILIVSFLTTHFKNYWLWISLGLVAWALLLTETRGAWIGAVVGFILLTWKFNRRFLLISLLICVVSFFFLPRSFQDRAKSIFNIHVSYDAQHQIHGASQTRFLIWSAGLKIIHDYPLGIGQGNLEDVYPRYRINIPFSELTVPHLHDDLLQVLAQNGWQGLAIYLFWIFAFYFEALRFKSIEPELNQWNWTFLCVFSAILVWGLTEYTFSHQFMYVQFFLLGLQINIWKTKQENTLTPSTV